MRIFVTGATGFVGRALTQFLLNQEDTVISLVHDWDGSLLRHDKYPKGLTHVGGDVRDFKRMREILFDYKPDAIVHLAAQAIVSQAAINPISTYETNVSGTINLLEAWKEACPQSYFLHFSTDKVYGNGLNKSETDPLQATGDAYAASKAAADLIAQSYGATVTRSCNIYGPGDKQPTRLIPDMIQTCLRNEQPRLRMPTAVREYIYVDDVCKILSWLIEGRKRGVWNIGSGKTATSSEVLQEILKHFPAMRTDFRTVPTHGELREQSLNTEKLCENMDCLAFTTLQAGIRETVEYWKQQAPLLSC